MFNQEPFSLSPVHFFQLSVDCFQVNLKAGFGKFEKKHLLPNTSPLCNEDYFADVSLGWNREGIAAEVSLSESFQEASYPNIANGDSVELMIDTRDVKTSGYNTRFCHHFFFLPESIEGRQAGEMTTFRTEDIHDLCDPQDLKVFCRKTMMQIFIPASCLYGYDPDQFDRLGFTYRINRRGNFPQHFSAVTNNFQVEQQPSLWSSLKLVK